MKSNKYVDFSFIGVLLILSGTTIYSHFSEGFLLSINNYLAFASLVLVLIVRIMSYKKTYRLMLLMLLLGTFGLINFSIGRNALSFGKQEGIVQIWFNFCLFGLFIAYCCINRKILLSIFHGFLRGTQREQEEERHKKIAFYYDKFSACSTEEFEGMYGKYKEYPQEAQTALKQIKAERG